jgi:hypothetical protein
MQPNGDIRVMDEKQAIIKLIMPKAVLKALTPEAYRAIPKNLQVSDMACIKKYPFCIGRESRVTLVDGKLEMERRTLSDCEPNNDLYLIDFGEFLNISREHLMIDQRDNGYIVIDRGSDSGTFIGEKRVGGGDSGGTSELKDGDIIAIGAHSTPYRYKFISLIDDL